MFRFSKVILALALLSVPAAAQQKSVAIDRIAVTLGQCVSTSEQRADEIEGLRSQIYTLQAKLKALEDKSTPKE